MSIIKRAIDLLTATKPEAEPLGDAPAMNYRCEQHASWFCACPDRVQATRNPYRNLGMVTGSGYARVLDPRYPPPSGLGRPRNAARIDANATLSRAHFEEGDAISVIAARHHSDLSVSNVSAMWSNRDDD